MTSVKSALKLPTGEDLQQRAEEWLHSSSNDESYLDASSGFAKKTLGDLLRQVQKEALDYYEALSGQVANARTLKDMALDD